MLGCQPSRYNVLVPLSGGRTLAYNASSGGMALWDAHERALHDDLQAGRPVDLGDAAWAELARGGFVVPCDSDELGELRARYEAHRFDSRSLVLTIAPTLACNFGCDYCFQGQDKPGDTMGEAVQDGIVALVERSTAARRLHVAWYGGEPLLRPRVIESLSARLLQICQRRGMRYDASIVTNGYALDEPVARTLHALSVRTVQVTLDGAEHDHDRRRALLSGRPTFRRIVENLRAAAHAVPLRFNVRINIDRRNAGDIEQLMAELAGAGLSGRPDFRIYFAPVEAITEGCHGVADDCMGKAEYGRLEAHLYRRAIELGLAAMPQPPRFHGTCAAVRPGGLVIVPTGAVHKCWDTVNQPAHAIGDVFDLEALSKSPALLRWLRWSPFDHPACRDCRLLPVCAGACAYKFLHAEDTLGEAAELPCPSWKYNIKERLLLRAEKMGAIDPADIDRSLPGALTDPAELCIEGAPAAPIAPRRARRTRLPIIQSPSLEDRP